MQFYRHTWYYFGGVLFVALAFIMGFWGNTVSQIQVVLIYSFMALLIHQLEEYALPGGFPGIFNISVLGERAVPERYPLNANQCLIVNVFLAYPFYLAAILLPNVIWLGIAQVLFGMLQLIVHGLLINVRMKSLYNPGLASVVFLHMPIGIYYLWYVTAHGLAHTGDYIFGVIATFVAAALMVALPILVFRNKQSKYPFSEAEMYRFGKDKLKLMLNA